MRCKEQEATIVHSRRKRIDGSFYEVKWCRECQRTQKHDQAKRKLNIPLAPKPPVSDEYLRLAKETALRIAGKYQ